MEKNIQQTGAILRKSNATVDYYYGNNANQDLQLNEMNITKSQAESYRKYCTN